MFQNFWTIDIQGLTDICSLLLRNLIGVTVANKIYHKSNPQAASLQEENGRPHSPHCFCTSMLVLSLNRPCQRKVINQQVTASTRSEWLKRKMESFFIPYCHLLKCKLLVDLITLSYVCVKCWKDPACTYSWRLEIMAQWTDVYFHPVALCGNEFLGASNIHDSTLMKSQVKTKCYYFGEKF